MLRLAARNERALGAALRTLRDGALFELLGFVRLGDYVVERLGLSARTAQELIRVDVALDGLPLTAVAFERGAISTAHVRILARVATRHDEGWWLARARTMSVRKLASLAMAERRRKEARRAATGLEAEGPPPYDGAAPWDTPPAAAGVTPAPVQSHTGTDEPGFEVEPESFVLTISLPVWMRGLWRDTVTLARRLAGSPLSAGSVLGIVLAESEAGVLGVGERQSHVGVGPTTGDGSDPRTHVEDGTRGAGGVLGQAHDAFPSRAHSEMPRAPAVSVCTADFLGSGRVGSSNGLFAARDTAVPLRNPRDADPATAKPAQKCPGDRPAVSSVLRVVAREIDGRLHELVRSRQRFEAALASRLASARSALTWLAEGHATMADYARERLGVSERQMYYLLALDRKLQRLPGLHRAHVAGRLTLRQTLLVGRVAARRSVQAWVRRAEQVTLRRLEDEVEYWEHLREVSPEAWSLLDEGPLPEGIALVPGHAPRLHVSAQREPEGALEDRGSHAEPLATGTGVTAPLPGNQDGDPSPRTYAGREPEGSPEGPVPAGPIAEPAWDRSEAGGPLHVSAPGRAVSAAAFLAAIEAAGTDAASPERRSILRVRVDRDTRDAWTERVASCRSVATEPVEEWEVLALMLHDFWRTWDNSETRRHRRENPTLERDGWRCTAPGCRSVGSGRLQEHHIVFRSAGGALEDPSNLTTLCTGHHLRLLHGGFIRCHGLAPDDLSWELGVSPDAAPFLRFRGEWRTGGDGGDRPGRVAPAARVS